MFSLFIKELAIIVSIKKTFVIKSQFKKFFIELKKKTISSIFNERSQKFTSSRTHMFKYHIVSKKPIYRPSLNSKN